MLKLQINDVITVKYNQDYKIFKLYDIAVWKIGRNVKSIQMKQLEVPFAVRTKTQEKIEYDKLKRRSRHTFNHGDRFEVSYSNLPLYETSIYEIGVRSKWRNKELIGGVTFRKMMAS